MYNDKTQFTRLTLDQSNLHVEWSVPYEDVTGEDMLQAIRTLMIGMTFNDKTIESSMASYLIEHSDDYEVIEKEDNQQIHIGYDFETQGLDGGFPSPEEYENAKIETKPHFYA